MAKRKFRLVASFSIDPELRDLSQEVADRNKETWSAYVRRAVSELTARELSQSQQPANA